MVVEIVCEGLKKCAGLQEQDIFLIMSLAGWHGRNPSTAVCCLPFASTLPGSSIGCILLFLIKLCGTTRELRRCRRVV